MFLNTKHLLIDFNKKHLFVYPRLLSSKVSINPSRYLSKHSKIQNDLIWSKQTPIKPIKPIKPIVSINPILYRSHSTFNNDPTLNQQSTPSNDLKKDYKILQSLFIYIWPPNQPYIKLRVITAITLLISGKLLNVSVPFFFKHVVDQLNIIDGSSTTNTVFAVVNKTIMIKKAGAALLGYGAARLGSTVFSELRNAVFGSVAQGAIRTASKNILSHLHQMDLSFHNSRQTGGLVRSIDRGAKGINQVLTSILFHVVPTALEILLVCGIVAYQFGWMYSVITLTTMGAYTTFTFITTSWRTQFRKRMNQADNKAATIATDSLLNFEAVKHFNNEPFELEQYDEALKKYEKAAIDTTTSLAYLNIGQNVIVTISLTGLMWMASNGSLHFIIETGVISGNLSIGDIVMLNSFIFQLSMPLNFLGMVYRETKQSLLDMNVMFTLQQTQSTIQNSPHAVLLNKHQPLSVTFEDVVFGYTPERPILNHLSFHIPAGKTVAFVGPSGCGKSTLFKLLFRFHDPSNGTIKINGTDIKQIDLSSLRSSIGVVPQDTVLFNQTIGYNIKYGNIHSTPEDIKKAVKFSQLDQVISKFPKGYETLVGERGLMLSGGEKQRVQLARVYLKNPDLILFDEATSALDLKTESLIMDCIDEYLSNSTGTKTAIFIAHRLGTVKHCDMIHCMDNGVIVESGNHDELIKLGGVYSNTWYTQLSD